MRYCWSVTKNNRRCAAAANHTVRRVYNGGKFSHFQYSCVKHLGTLVAVLSNSASVAFVEVARIRAAG